MAKAGDAKCVCCGKYADGFVVMQGQPPFPPPQASLADGLLQGIVDEIKHALPACKNLSCNQKLREYSTKLAKVVEDDVAMMCAYDECKKVEERGGPEFM